MARFTSEEVKQDPTSGLSLQCLVLAHTQSQFLEESCIKKPKLDQQQFYLAKSSISLPLYTDKKLFLSLTVLSVQASKYDWRYKQESTCCFLLRRVTSIFEVRL